MGEQPIFTTKAHVFQIEPETKKKWLPASSQSVNVSFYYDSNRDTYRIISVEGTKAVINSTITPNMSFTQTSQKFGQWSDPRANTVYGLGFSSEADCSSFVDKFKEVKELTRQAVSKNSTPSTNGSSSPAPHTPPTIHAPANHINTDSPASSPKPNSQNDNERSRITPVGGSSSSSSQVDQLKYENDRLKIALAQSSANAKKWEVELQTLKNNNARLTTALQESNANVEEWKKQLAMYKEESAKMKKKMLEMEKMGGSELFQRQIVELREKINDMERQNQAKQDEIHDLNKRMGEVKTLETKNAQLQSKLQDSDKEKESLRRQISELRDQLDHSKSQSIRDKQQLRGLHESFGAQVSQMYELNDKLAELMQT